MLLGLAKGLQGIRKGERRRIVLSASEAYGYYDPNKVIYFPRQKLLNDVQVGKTVTVIGKSGKARSYRVFAIHADFVSLDGNHPLAGQDLVFEIETLAARDATQDEIDEASNIISKQILH